MDSVSTFKAAKGQQKLTMLTCYDYSMARIMEECAIDALLVGDSLGMVMLGYPSTIPVTLEEMIHHCAAVTRGAKNTLVVCDLPFMSFQTGIHDALLNAGRLIKEGGAQAVKLEGGAEFAPEIAALTRASIPVMGHIGLTPQSLNALGSYKVQGKDPGAAQKLLDDARAIEKAGAFALVLECVPSALAGWITRSVSIPVIGIGAGADCDGQVLVWQDMSGLGGARSPKFVRKFADANQMLRTAFSDYKTAVQSGNFPSDGECYHIEPEMLNSLI